VTPSLRSNKYPVLIPSRIIDLTAKENAYEDCIMALQKAFKEERLNMKEFLDNIRKLSNKQFKSILKRNKVITAIQRGAGTPEI
jgi:hypothetical protein